MAITPTGNVVGHMSLATTLNTGGTATLTSGAYSNVGGCEYIDFIVQFGAIHASGGFSVLKLQHSTAVAGTYNDVTGGDVVADGGITLDGDEDNKLVVIRVRTAGLRPFFKVVVTTAAAQDSIVNSIIGVGYNAKTAAPASTGAFTVLNVG